MGEGLQHKNPDQNTPNAVRPSKGVNPEQSNTNPEQSCNKPRTPVHPNPIEPSIEQNDDDEGACEFEDLTFREKVLLAMGHDRTGLTATGRIVCNPSQMIEVNRWIDDLALSQQEILMVIEATPCREGAPSSPKFYTHEMQKFAGEKVKPKLQPIATQGGGHSASKTAHKKSVEDDIAEAKRLRAERMAKGETR
jgi:predicted XRE-type DNA-binding protein